MATVLDTDQLDPRDRADAVESTVKGMSAPTHMAHNPSEGRIHAEIDAWRLGPVSLVHAHVSGFKQVRTPKLVRVSPSPVFYVGVMRRDSCRMSIAEEQGEFRTGQLFCMDYDLPYTFDWCDGTASGVHIELEQLGLPHETIRAALLRPQRSPLHSMVAGQLGLMADSADTLVDDPAALELGYSRVEMVRALVISAAGSGNTDGTALPADILLPQIRDYVRRRLSDPALNPGAIARAHNISVRYLYSLCARAGFSLEQWIITQRLERVRSDLARPETRHRSITSIAYHYGFRDQSHFSRRFRAAYGMTARDWRRTALEQPGATG